VTGGWTMLDPGETFKIGDHLFEFRLLPEGEPAPSGAKADAPSETPNVLREKPAAAPSLAEPGLASNEGSSRLTDMMPRDMGFSHQTLESHEEPGQRAS